jgi:pyroglutamyl-peptidase
MANRRILVTGFEPWGQWTRNPSGEIADELNGDRIGGYDLVTGVLPVRFEDDFRAALSLIEHHRPDAVVSLGLGGGPTLRMEKVALNLKGVDGGDVRILEEGPDAWFSALPIEAMVRRCREADVAAVVSYHAGTFMCNHIMYRLRQMAEGVGPDIPTGFIHLPPMPEQVGGVGEALGMPKPLIKKGVMESLAALAETLGNQTSWHDVQ